MDTEVRGTTSRTHGTNGDTILESSIWLLPLHLKRVSWSERERMPWMHVDASSCLGNEVTGTPEQTQGRINTCIHLA
uniref:Uncharacterized protein n=1 Tax=Setaria viridis TaxID=4556 RepID=A0A4U6VLP4_SETVI|nr:hypothetical protein SEVIR_3G403000v2 [Setaria viridis]TKW29555.1 hypothetical protein SEVIR_3G403000v2 [Setaria viridis]